MDINPNKPPKDMLGRELAIGDRVAHIKTTYGVEATERTITNMTFERFPSYMTVPQWHIFYDGGKTRCAPHNCIKLLV